MKIISKYKDFYDYIVQDHNADLNYVRHIGLINEYHDDLFKRTGNSIHYYSSYYGYQDYSYSKRRNGEFTFDSFIFGIYPFVYSQPIVRIYYRNHTGVYDKFIILGHDLVNKLLDDSKIVSTAAYENELIPLIQEEFDKLVKQKVCEPATIFYYGKTFNNSLESHVWKVDCSDIFYKIEAPVFIKYYYDLFVNGAYWENWPETPVIGDDDHTHYVTNISFQKLNYNILKYWYNDLFDLNTYINIENFLWSIKQEPIANPDNKTKIIAHGFDLKTSFRKDKCNK